jgi:hypothetical protein
MDSGLVTSRVYSHAWSQVFRTIRANTSNRVMQCATDVIYAAIRDIVHDEVRDAVSLLVENKYRNGLVIDEIDE